MSIVLFNLLRSRCPFFSSLRCVPFFALFDVPCVAHVLQHVPIVFVVLAFLGQLHCSVCCRCSAPLADSHRVSNAASLPSGTVLRKIFWKDIQERCCGKIFGTDIEV